MNTLAIHTDHKPLTLFLNSSQHEGIYANWVDGLHQLNIHITYIPGLKNKVADGPLRTLFATPECEEEERVKHVLEDFQSQGPQWVWKDGKGGYSEFLDDLTKEEKSQVLQTGTFAGVSVYSITADASWQDSYLQSAWFGDLYCFLHAGIQPLRSQMVSKSLDYYLNPADGLLYYYHPRYEFRLLCIPKNWIARVLREAHDEVGHWGKRPTIARLHRHFYWPRRSSDIDDYITGCVPCIQHNSQTATKPVRPVLSFSPKAFGAWILSGPSRKRFGVSHMSSVLSTTSRLTPWGTPPKVPLPKQPYPACLSYAFQHLPRPDEIYCDPGTHFTSASNFQLKAHALQRVEF